MRTLNLVFQSYVRQAFNSYDLYVKEILDGIDNTYPHIVNPETIIYLPLFPEEVEGEKNKGKMIMYADNGVANIAAYQVVVSFINLPEDYASVRDSIIERYGSKAIKSEIIETLFIGDPL